MNVLVPLGGLGTRFQKEGYLTRPKPFVPVLGKPMILWVLENLSLTKDDTLMIIFNPDFMSIGRFMREVVGDKFPNCRFVELPGPTRGAAETVLIGLRVMDETEQRKPTMLVDGDCFYTADVVRLFREVSETRNGCFCFHDTQEKPIYSYIKFDDHDDIIQVKEKVKISDWANSGCYCFRDGAQLAAECDALIESNSKQASQDGIGEFYTSGVIAAMLEKKEPFRALKLNVSNIHVLGTPAQVERFCETWPTQSQQRFVFDLESVLIIGIRGQPIARNIELCQALKKQGHTIVIQSTRLQSAEMKTWALLQELKIPCDELCLGKPRGEFYIGGPTTIDGVLGDLPRQIGFHKTPVRAARQPRDVPAKEVPVKKPKMNQLSELVPDSRGVTCLVKILDEPKVIETITRNGINLRFYEVTAGDATAKVVLSLTEAQLQGVEKDKTLIIRNSNVKMIKNHIRLVVDKWGKLDFSTDEKVETIGDANVSTVEWELTT